MDHAAELEDKRLSHKLDEPTLSVGQEHMSGVAAVINHALKCRSSNFPELFKKKKMSGHAKFSKRQT